MTFVVRLTKPCYTKLVIKRYRSMTPMTISYGTFLQTLLVERDLV